MPNVTPWLPPESMEDDLIAPVIEAELAGLRVLEPELAKGYDQGLSATSRMSAAVATVLTAGLIKSLWTSAGDRSSVASLSHWRREARRARITDRVSSPALPASVLDRWRIGNEERYFRLREKVRRETELRIRLDRAVGRRPETIAADFALNGLPTHNGRMRGRALVIAQDQLHTLSSLLTRQQQEDAGIEFFIWRTREDSKVRKTHNDLLGRRFRWAKPPPVGYPGEPVGCRCWAEGVV